ncbi:MAG: type I DNA topoisomerase [Amoebophilaceae bacterium]|jgi:DNA topoisomerase-1|nr:type I DNA topoisomerase [Amoebophilaceae bacterium]
MSKYLVIVESPAKAKTIAGYLGTDYQVASCYGHIRDLPKKGKAIDVAHGFQPTYEVSQDKQHIVTALKASAKQADCVYLASDDDREGESISWHLKEALELNDAKIKRIVFREITKYAILNALKNPRGIDLALVNSQQARRVLDRLVGYDLSPILWKKVKRGLSAGRVQSVAVRMIVEQERAICAFKSVASFVITALFDLGDGKYLQAELPERFKTEAAAHQFLELCKSATFSISNLEQKAAKKSPAPPFTTSTLQQEASRKLGYSVTRTMVLAQRLYEAGEISYMRTDSVHLSQEAVAGAQQEIHTTYGADYFQSRTYKTKTTAAQEAHEAIRPTDFSKRVAGEDSGAQRLYALIWKRAIASQMADALLEKTVATVAISTAPHRLVAKGEVIKFEGFLKVYAATQDEDDLSESQGMLPPLTIGQRLKLDCMKARERFSKPPARYTEASLVKQLEERGIGRPSTYAPIITTIQKRGYVVKEDREGHERSHTVLTLQQATIQRTKHVEIAGTEKQKLFPTDIAMVVNDFLVAHFSEVTDYGFTAKIEEELDIIAQGRKEWNAMLAEFYGNFHPKVEQTAQIDRSTLGTSRLLGQVPNTGQAVIVRLGKYGPLVQIGEIEGETAPKFASLQKNQRIESITLEEALKLFELPREIGSFENSPVVVNTGRYGPYVKHNEKFYSLGREDDPLTIDVKRATEIIQAKRKADAERVIKWFDNYPDIQILNGRWGPYIKAGRKNVKIPKEVEDPSTLTLDACLTLVENAPAKKQRGKKE